MHEAPQHASSCLRPSTPAVLREVRTDLSDGGMRLVDLTTCIGRGLSQLNLAAEDADIMLSMCFHFSRPRNVALDKITTKATCTIGHKQEAPRDRSRPTGSTNYLCLKSARIERRNDRYKVQPVKEPASTRPSFWPLPNPARARVPCLAPPRLSLD